MSPAHRPPLIERPRWTCALGGALAAAGALPRTVPILHCGPGCAGNFAWTNNGGSGLAVTGPCLGLNVPATNLQENEVVFGGLDRLREEIKHSLAVMDGDLYFVLTGCVPEVIGDDAESLVGEFAGAGAPVVFASGAGFKGDSYFGYEQVLKTLFRRVVKPGAARSDDLVNVWGVPPFQDAFWKGNLTGVKELLELLGFRANLFFGPESDLAAVKNAAGARLNVVLSDVYGIEAAVLFKELHGVDFVIAPLPFGAAASERFLQTTGRALGRTGRQLKSVIEKAGRRHYEYLESIIDVFNDMEAQRHALVVGDANYAPALTDFLAEDLGWLPELVVITDNLSEEAQGRLERRRKGAAWQPARLLFEAGSAALAEAARAVFQPPQKGKYHQSGQPLFVAGSSLDRALAGELGAGHLSLSFPVANRAVLSRGYTGYSGGLRLTEDIVSACIALR
jgi:nitrogenase molybdenum-iron protein beta chain